MGRRGGGAGAHGGGASGRKATREVGGGGAGEDGSKDWSRESGGSNETSDTRTEEDEGDTPPADGVAKGNTRKRGERATWVCEGRRERRTECHLRNGQQGGRQAAMGQGNNKWGKREAAGNGEV